MKKIFQKINSYIRVGLNIITRITLDLAFFIILFPFWLFVIPLFLLKPKKVKTTYWHRHIEINDIESFLRQQ